MTYVCAYDRDTIERYLPGVWDKDFVNYYESEYAPDRDMPNGMGGLKNTSNTLWAELADIQQAWKRARLTFKERRALFLHHGIGLPVKEVARHEGVRHPVISDRLYSGIGKLMDHLNGDNYFEGQDDE